MAKKVYILAFLIFGFLVTPTLTFACGKKTEKSCCEKEASSKSEKKECCKKKDSKNKNCGGKCGRSCCTINTLNFNTMHPNELVFEYTIIQLFIEKSKFHTSKTFIRSGFTSIWIPPNIA
jgi:hypothetical protein